MVHNLFRRLAITILLAALAASAWALTVSIAPAEDRAFAPPPDGQGSPMGDLVSGCLNALFDAGYIVTDAGVSWTAEADWGSSSYGLQGAREGRVNCIIALYVRWEKSTFHKGALLATSIRYRLIRTSDEKILAEGSVAGPPDSESRAAHEAHSASEAGSAVVGRCLKALSALSSGGE